jgi:hypothetical protein
MPNDEEKRDLVRFQCTLNTLSVDLLGKNYNTERMDSDTPKEIF